MDPEDVAQDGMLDDGGQSGVQSEAPANEGTSPAWDSEANPYRQKYTGLQGTFKQVAQENQTLKMQMLATQAQMAINAAKAAGKSQEEIAGIQQIFQGRAEQVQAMDALAVQQQQLGQQRQMLEPMAKQVVLGSIATKYGLKAEDLADAPNPEAAEYLARKLSGKPASQQRLSRPAATVSQVESSGSFRATGGMKIDDLPISEKLKLGVQREIQKASRTRR
jgi:hypothetical protein